jgi:hypothetical protein
MKEVVLDKLSASICQKFLKDIEDLKFNDTNEFCATDEVRLVKSLGLGSRARLRDEPLN